MKLKFLLAVLFITITAFSAKNEFLSKDFIDTTIQSAYYGFVAANNKEAGGTTQLNAIHRARGVVEDLKKKAENDPNRRYILFRLSELEAQIGLEEEEVRLKQQYAKVQKINELVELFNKEVLQPRPNFANLYTLYNRMVSVDTRKTNEFGDIINQKNRSVTHNLKSSITNAFNNSNYRQAEIDYHYAVENLKYMNLSVSEVEVWRRRIQAKKDADYLKENIDSRVAFINGIVRENRLLEARRHIEVLSSDLNGASALLEKPFVFSTKMKLDGLTVNIDRREDSLIQHGFKLVNEGKHKEASDFLKNVLYPAGADRNRTAKIDRIIIEAEGGNRKPMFESSLRVENVGEESGMALNAAMMNRTKAKADSIRAVQEYEERKSQEHFEKKSAGLIKKHIAERNKQRKIQNQCDVFLERILTMLEQGNSNAAVKQFRGKQALCFENATPRLYYDVKVKINQQIGANNYEDNELSEVNIRHNSDKPEAKQNKSAELMGEIYDLIDKNQAASAYSQMYFNRYLLEEYSYPEAFVSMKKAVVKAYAKEVGIK